MTPERLEQRGVEASRLRPPQSRACATAYCPTHRNAVYDRPPSKVFHYIRVEFLATMFPLLSFASTLAANSKLIRFRLSLFL